MLQLTTKELKEKISNGENFVLDLYATWCGPCKVMLTNLEKVNESLIKESNGSPSFGIYKFDVDTLEMCNTNPNINPVWTELGISKGSIDYYYHTKNGEIQKIFQNYEIAIPDFFNNLNRNLKGYILNSDNSKKDDW